MSNANSYMQQQITRLESRGLLGYEIFQTEFFALSDYHNFPCITVKARRKDATAVIYGDGYHYIEIDYPWFPFISPEHRI